MIAVINPRENTILELMRDDAELTREQAETLYDTAPVLTTRDTLGVAARQAQKTLAALIGPPPAGMAPVMSLYADAVAAEKALRDALAAWDADTGLADRFAAVGIALPLAMHPDECDTIIDAHGGYLLQVDPMGVLLDSIEVTEQIGALLVEAINGSAIGAA